ncbi:MAG TPA: nucleoside-diphosphate sugar epimerase/dehydratase [Thermoleophilaceae bacterium]|nr:nucleoside-diphosphate sugar epimerase/dehydratase [Thermoleophilaceae bacterium]
MKTRITSSVAARRLGQVGVDACLVALAYYLAFVLRFDSGIPERYQELLAVTVGFVVLLKVSLFAAFGLYSKLWRFVDQADFESIVKAVVVSSFVLIAGLFLLPFGVSDPPRGVMALDFLITLALVGGARFLVRAVVERPLRQPLVQRADTEVLIVGAGNGGQQVALELRRNPELSSAVIGFVDDDPRKKGMLVAGHRVFGTTEELARILDDTQPDEVVIAIPSAPGELRLKVVTACRERDIPVRTLPTVFELLSRGSNLLRQVREVKVEDVLGREPVRAETDTMGGYMRDSVVAVTGAGGSIGAELCRQIARVKPRRLILVDHAENNLFEIRRHLEEEQHFGSLAAVLADCKDATRMQELFAEEKPSVVFHAAAYKHVGLMEENPVEAVRNNAVATRIVAAAAGEAGVERFVLVSTDKAVAPATVMGASKALAEWAVEASQNRYRDTRYASVRFGNVLGSSGSVVPIFRKQIAAGGPVTVTDPEMTRYFMTIPEAVQLIIRAADLVPTPSGSRAGESNAQPRSSTFVLEMGDPVRIVDLARNMIRLSGKEPDVDIAIEVVGRRPGEKIHEELFEAGERPEPTPADRIVAAVRPRLDASWVEDAFARIEDLVFNGDAAALADAVAQMSAERSLTAHYAPDAGERGVPDPR